MFQTLGGVAVIGDEHVGGVAGPQEAQRHVGRRAQCRLRVRRRSRSSCGKPCGKPGKVVRQSRRRGRGVRQRRQDDRGRSTTTPMLAHAAMEPPTAVADFRDGKVEVWTPVQDPQAAQDTVAAALGIDKKNVTCHVTLLGGGFGRKSKPDFAAEAAILSKQLGKPVKVIWTREDDIRFDFYHATAAVYHKAAVDAKGRPTAWLTRTAFQPIASTFVENAAEPMSFELDLGVHGPAVRRTEHAGRERPAEANVRIGWFRAVTNNFHVFASGSFVDEMAHAAGRDPLEYLLDLLGPNDTWTSRRRASTTPTTACPSKSTRSTRARLRQVIEVAAEKAGWATRAKGNGRGIGIAAHRSFNSYVASVVEVVDRRARWIHSAAHRSGDRRRPHRQSRSRAVAARRRRGHGRRTGAQRRDHRRGGRIQQSNFNDFPGGAHDRRAGAGQRHLRGQRRAAHRRRRTGRAAGHRRARQRVFAATGKRVRELPISRCLRTAGSRFANPCSAKASASGGFRDDGSRSANPSPTSTDIDSKGRWLRHDDRT